MAKDLYEENKELKRALYNVEKAILDFRLTQLDLPLEKVNAPSIGLPRPQVQPVPYTITTTCSCGDDCKCDEEKEVLREQIEILKARLAQYEQEQEGPVEGPVEAPPVEEEWEEPADDAEEVVLAEPEPAPPVEEKKPRKPRKERGGSVFTDFRTLTLENNDFEGNSIVHSKKDM